MEFFTILILSIISLLIYDYQRYFGVKKVRIINQAPPQPQTPPPPPAPKEDLNDKIREEIRRQVELEVHQQLKDIRQRLEKDIEIGITAYIHKQRARQARAQESKDKK